MPRDRQASYQSLLPKASTTQTRLLLSLRLVHLPDRREGEPRAARDSICHGCSPHGLCPLFYLEPDSHGSQTPSQHCLCRTAGPVASLPPGLPQASSSPPGSPSGLRPHSHSISRLLAPFRGNDTPSPSEPPSGNTDTD